MDGILDQLEGGESKGAHYHAHEQAHVIAHLILDIHPRAEQIEEEWRLKQIENLKAIDGPDPLDDLNRAPQVIEASIGLSVHAEDAVSAE